MGKQKLDRLKKILAILLVVLFVLSVTAVVINAKSTFGAQGGKSVLYEADTKNVTTDETEVGTEFVNIDKNVTMGRTTTANAMPVPNDTDTTIADVTTNKTTKNNTAP